MKKLLFILLSLFGVLYGAQTLDIPEPMVLGSNGYDWQANKLVGEQGTLLIKVRQNKPDETPTVNRTIFTLQCNSRLNVRLYITHSNFNKFIFAFGDRNKQIYQEIEQKYEFGKDYWMGISWNGKTVQFFHEGMLYSALPQPIKLENIDKLYLGPFKNSWNSNGKWPDDTIVSALKLYDTALSPAEVAKECGVKLIPSVEQYPGILTAPVLAPQQVTVDGNLKEDIWKTAASLPVLTNGHHPEQTYQAPNGRFLISSDDKNLYLGLNYSFPAGSKVTPGSLRKPGVEPEVWGSESFEFWITLNGDEYRFGGNVAGGYTERKNKGNEWNGAWQYASHLGMEIDNSYTWQAEAAIPWSTFGLDAPPAKGMKFTFGRTWCLPAYSGSSSVAHSGTYQNNDDYLDLCFVKNAVTLRKLNGNDPSRGILEQKVSITSPVAQKVRYEIASADSTGAAKTVQIVCKDVDMKAGETVELDMNGRIFSSNCDQLRYTLSAGGNVYARNTTPIVMNEVLLDAYPRFIAGYIDVEVPSAMLQEKFGKGLSVVLTSPGKTEVARAAINGDKLVLPFDNKKNPKGTYLISVQNVDKNVLSQLELYFPGMGAWTEADKLFPKDRILPPFTPMTSKGNSYSIWGRTYTYDKSFFPTQVTALNENMLAGTPELVANGRVIECTQFNKGASAKHHADFTAIADNDVCSVTENGWIEYDGVSYSKFALKAKQELQGVKLRFKVPNEVARYLHAVIGGTWGAKITRKITDEPFVFDFYPMVWIGKEDKGICFFTETDLGWKYPKGKAISITRHGNSTFIEFSMRNKIAAGENFNFEFGYLGTPVKPLPSRYPNNSKGDTECVPMQRPGSNTFIGYHIPVSPPYPYEIEDVFGNLPSEEKSPSRQCIKEGIERLHKYGKKSINYMDGRMLTDEYPEVTAFKDEWQFQPRRTLEYKRDGKLHYIIDMCPNAGGCNFFLMQLKHFIETMHPDGVYYDFGTIAVCNNKLHGCEQRWPILGYREYLRRTYMLLLDSGIEEPGVGLHNTDNVEIPAITFATHLVNGEHIRQQSTTIMHNGRDIQDTYDIEMFASELNTMPFGITNSVYQANDVLRPQYGGGKEDPELYKFRITQAFMAGTLVHNTMLSQSRCHYGILEKVARCYDDFDVHNSRFIGYWEKPIAITGSDKIYASIYVNDKTKSALAIVAHIGKDHDVHNVKLAFDEKVLGFKPTQATDMMRADDPEYQELYEIRERNKVPDYRAPLKLGDWGSNIISFNGKVLNLTIKYHTFAIIKLK